MLMNIYQFLNLEQSTIDWPIKTRKLERKHNKRDSARGFWLRKLTAGDVKAFGGKAILTFPAKGEQFRVFK